MVFDVISIGTAAQDIFLPLKGLSTSKTNEGREVCLVEGSKNDIEKPVFATGGGAINSAVTFARQGLKTAALFRVGDDYAGTDIWEEMKKEGVDFWKIEDESLATGHAAILLSPKGERTILVYRGATEDFKLKEIPFSQLKAKWVFIYPSHIDFELMQKIIEHCYFQGISIAFNPSKYYLENHGKNLKLFLDKIKVLVVNREEAAYLTGISKDDEKKIFEKLDKLIKGIAVITDGPRGVHVSDGKTLYHAGVFLEKEIIDRTGAGDAFGSGFVAGLILKNDIEYAIRLGTANATSVVEVVGAHISVLTRHEFEKGRRWQNLKIVKSQLSIINE